MMKSVLALLASTLLIAYSASPLDLAYTTIQLEHNSKATFVVIIHREAGRI